MPLGGGEPRRLSDWNDSLTGLVWTPDGREIIYSVEEPAASRLWRIDANGTKIGRGSPLADISVAATLSVDLAATAGATCPSRVSNDHPIDVDLQMLDLEAGLVNDTIDAKPFANSTRVEASARFSPDGRRIAFASYRSGGAEVWIAERDGSGIRQITSMNAPQLVVCGWSPDGTRILFDAAIDGNSDVYVVGADGGQLRRVTSEASIEGVPSWSHDGRWIYFSSTRAGVTPDAWRMSADGGEAQRITHNGGFEPKESPDGQYLFYLAGGHPARPGNGPNGQADAPCLSRVGQEASGARARAAVSLVGHRQWHRLRHARSGLRRDRSVSLQRSACRRVGRLGFRLPGSYTHMSASRDGRWVLATRMVRSDSDLMRLDNFR